jgi:hypothetical protein
MVSEDPTIPVKILIGLDVTRNPEEVFTIYRHGGDLMVPAHWTSCM